METITLIYIDDKIDLYVSRYLSKYRLGNIEYKYTEYKFDSNDSYESLIKNENIEKADILILDSMLFENNSITNGKITGEELGLIIKKIFPFKEIIIITQYQAKIKYSTLKKYNSQTYDMKEDDFFEKEWKDTIKKSIDKVLLDRDILNKIESKKYLEKYFFERIKNTMSGICEYENLKKKDVDKLIFAFEEMRNKYEK